MFKLSKKGEYAIRTIFHLSFFNDVCITSEIAKSQQIPMPFLKKIIQSLKVGGLVNSVKGKGGGIILKVSPAKLSMKQVIETIEGPIVMNECLACTGACKREEICPFYVMWADCQNKVADILDSWKFGKVVEHYKKLIEKNKKRIKGGILYPNNVPVLDLSLATG